MKYIATQMKFNYMFFSTGKSRSDTAVEIVTNWFNGPIKKVSHRKMFVYVKRTHVKDHMRRYEFIDEKIIRKPSFSR